MKFSGFLFLSFFGWGVLVSTENPGLTTRITAKGFNYAADVLANVLNNKLRTIEIRDISRSGRVSASVTNLHIQSFSAPTGNAQLVTGQGIRMSLGINRATILGNWRYSARMIFRIRDSGGIKLTLSGTSVSVLVQLKKTNGGGISMASERGQCHSNVGFRAEVRGWIYNLIIRLMRRRIERELENVVCNAVVKIINEDGNYQLSTLPVMVDIEKKYLLDYRLLRSPVFTSRYMEMNHKGKVSWKGDNQAIPFSPPNLAPMFGTNKMLYLELSDYAINTLGYSAHKHNQLKFRMTSQNLRGDKRDLFKTTCSSGNICIGEVLPQLAVAFPNSELTLSMATTSRPRVLISDELRLQASGLLNFDITSPNGTSITLFGISVNFLAGLTAHVANSKLYSRINHFNFTMNSHGTNLLPSFDINPLRNILQIAIQVIVLPHINAFGSKGIMLPVLKNVDLVNTQLSFVNHAMIIGTDVAVTV